MTLAALDYFERVGRKVSLVDRIDVFAGQFPACHSLHEPPAEGNRYVCDRCVRQCSERLTAFRCHVAHCGRAICDFGFLLRGLLHGRLQLRVAVFGHGTSRKHERDETWRDQVD